METTGVENNNNITNYTNYAEHTTGVGNNITGVYNNEHEHSIAPDIAFVVFVQFKTPFY